MNAKKVIIDCDPGIDDVLALLLALRSPELDVLGITVVCGNVPTTQGAENALKVLALLERLDVPVYLGERKPLVRPYVDATDTHGATQRMCHRISGTDAVRTERCIYHCLGPSHKHCTIDTGLSCVP